MAYLLLLRWLARDFEGVYQMCACCASDSPLSAEEAQLWALLADFDDDMEPEAHACSGGVLLLARGGRLRCDNTLDARLGLCFTDLKPVVGKMLFPKN